MQANNIDIDPLETSEWIEALYAINKVRGNERAKFIIDQLVRTAYNNHIISPSTLLNTPYCNTIQPELEEKSPGDQSIEHSIRSIIRWNAIAIILHANSNNSNLGGHIASFQSSALLYDVGFNHFWHATTEDHGGDLVYFQGHSAPGIYARAFVEGRFNDQQLLNYRQETTGNGLSSYPHPWLMPNFWQFPTVSMGLGPLMGIYQAKFLKYLENRELLKTNIRKVWVFVGDGECDEPETLGAISVASREKLDNLIFVVNCNLQRLDGPVRGNGKIIQELEAIFHGAGWKVIKVIWGKGWDNLIEKDKKGILLKRMEECVDGEYQDFKSKNGSYVREKFFGKYPELKELVINMSDEEIWSLKRGGHDSQKVYAAYASAVKSTCPTVILAKTVKGYGMGEAGEAYMTVHQIKKMTIKALQQFRDRFRIPVPDTEIGKLPLIRFPDSSIEMQYLKERRNRLGGYLPQRLTKSVENITIPQLDIFSKLLNGFGEREVSTTTVFVQILNILLKDKIIGKKIVPIIPDESRTFGMEGLFRQYGIYSSVGQLYKPQDKEQLMYYREEQNGQVLQEGINEAGAMASWIAAATSYSTNNLPMIPFYIYYSMFGFQRCGDLAWAAGDMRCRGFLIGGTSGRTTLNGEGLQHADGHSHIIAGTIPNCVTYDPSFSYEIAVIIHHGLHRMVKNQEDIYFYITITNENYIHPPIPNGVEEGIIKGIYLLYSNEEYLKTSKVPIKTLKSPSVQLLGCGSLLQEVITAAKIIATDFNITANVWSVTSFNEIRKDCLATERWNLLHPRDNRKNYLELCLENHVGPIVAVSDYIRSFTEQISHYLSRNYIALGTDGFGRSDYRDNLRRFFEINKYYIVLAALKLLADDGQIEYSQVEEAIDKYQINTEKPAPWLV